MDTPRDEKVSEPRRIRGRKRFHLAILVGLWRRPALTGVCLSAIKRELRATKLSWKIYCVGSEGHDSQIVAQAHQAEYIEYQNEPLGMKFNAGLHHIRPWDPDAVMVLGSDNVATAAFVERSTGYIDDGYDVTGCLDAYVLNIRSLQAVHWPGYPPGHSRHGEPIGSGRCYSGDILEKVNWNLWGGGRAGGMDGRATASCKGAGARWKTFRIEEPKYVHIGLKGTTSIGSWGSIASRSKEINMREMLDRSFRGKLFGCIESLRGKDS